MLILEYPNAIWVQVVSYRYYIITTKDQNGNLIYVHSYGSMAGLIKPNAHILIEPSTSSKRKTTHYILAINTPTGVLGVNTSLSNYFFTRCTDLKLIPFSILSKQITYLNSRFDFKVNYNKQPYFLEVKSCFFVYNQICYFPVKLITDLPKLENKSNTSTISTRAIKHLKGLKDNVLVFIAQTNNFNKFKINPRQKELTQSYNKISNKFLIKLEWTYDKKLFFRSFQNLP